MNRRRFCAAAGAGVLLAGCKSLPKPDGGPVRVFIIHGYGATVADHWFPWLAQQLRRRGMEVVPVPLPDSLHPDFAAALSEPDSSAQNRRAGAGVCVRRTHSDAAED